MEIEKNVDKKELIKNNICNKIQSLSLFEQY
jgi:hypothetical protein